MTHQLMIMEMIVSDSEAEFQVEAERKEGVLLTSG